MPGFWDTYVSTSLLPKVGGFFPLKFGNEEEKSRFHVLITGCDSGFGAGFARDLDSEGFTGVLMMHILS